MSTLYSRIASHNLDRLAGLSDGVFAFAMTLLALDLHTPAAELIHSEHDLWRSLAALAPRLVMYLMSFLTLGIFWNGQQTQLNHIERADHHLSWIHLGFLVPVTLVPFSTQLLADFPAYRAALVVYWLNILVMGVALYASWRYASRHKLIRASMPIEARRAVRRRVVIAQSLYALGAALCLRSTRWSIAFILAVQLNYAIAPQLRRTPTPPAEQTPSA